MATKKKKPVKSVSPKVTKKGVFALGLSAISGKVYAGLVRDNRFVGKKFDVTTSFLHTVIVWLTEDNGTKMFARTISDSERTWEISIRLLPKVPDGSVQKPHESINGAVARMARMAPR